MIDRIIYLDDNLVNGLTATAVDSRIDFVSDLEQLERPLGDYSCIITDMQMKHAESGFEVVERAIREGRLPYVATGGTYEHGGTFNRVRVFNSDLVKTFDGMSKSEERFWRDLLQFIDAEDGNSTQQALRKTKEPLGIVPEDQVRILMGVYRMNYSVRRKSKN
ncbi:MAG: hypothetical protein ABH864_02405 [archaeon]